MNNLTNQIQELVLQYPNDMELGGKVRQLVLTEIENYKNWLDEHKDSLIFESPDGGKTFYSRKFGQSPNERVMVNETT